MRLIRFGSPGNEKPGVQLDDGSKVDVSSFGEDYDEHFFGTDGNERLGAWLKANAGCALISESVRLGPPLSRPSKIVFVGLNYAQHAAERGMTIPKEPVLFFKSTSAIVGPNDDLILPNTK
jgi:2,4-diketo-3-deoxy-L-fuconate hydrolase